MKKLLALILAAILAVATLAACSSNDPEPTVTPPPASSDAGDTPAAAEEASEGDPDVETGSAGSGTPINLYSFTDEVPNMAARYVELYPDFGYSFNWTIIGTDDGAYDTALATAIASGGSSAPDMYTAEMAFVLKYSQGDAAHFALSYDDLGISDVSGKLAAADIAQYAIDLGSNGGKVMALPFQATGSAFIYRRDIASEVFGTDDSAAIEAEIGPGWDKFWAAADKVIAAGYKMVSGLDDVWKPVENSSDTGWIVGGKLNIDPKREAFLDMALLMKENGYSNETEGWSDPWFADMSGTSATPAFGFLGPAWLINYVMASNAGDTYGNWNICAPPVGFGWGGTWIFANKNLNADAKDGVKTFIEWLTLDITDDGLQYRWANNTLFTDGTTKDTVASATVMARSNGEHDFLGGADMFPAFIKGNEFARGDNKSQYDETINAAWMDQVRQYAGGNKDRDAAIADFRSYISDMIGID